MLLSAFVLLADNSDVDVVNFLGSLRKSIAPGLEILSSGESGTAKQRLSRRQTDR